MKPTHRALTLGFFFVFFLILLFLGGLHVFISQVLKWPGIELMCGVGFLSMPLAFFISRKGHGHPLYFLVWVGYIWMGFFFISLNWAVVVAILSPWVTITWEWNLGLCVALSLGALWQGLRGPVVVKEIIHKPELAGLRAVQITDLHVGLLAHDEKWFSRVVEQVNRLDADFVFLTGDLVEGPFSLVQPMLKDLAIVKSKIAKIYVSGNHEMIHGGLHWEQHLADCGWTVLHNQNRVYSYGSQKIQLAGVPDRMITRFDPSCKSDPDAALKTEEKVDYRILLAHEPSSVLDLKTESADLLLSGHTHGGQIFPFGFLVRMVQPVNRGWKKIRNIWVYAHQGTGLWGPPMRLGTQNQIVVFEFTP